MCKAVAHAIAEIADHVEVLVTGENQTPAEMPSKDAIDGLGELTGEIDSNVETASHTYGSGVSLGPAAHASGDTAP